jgi:hypothetical protein
LLRPEAGEVILFADVVAGVVRRHPIAQGIDFEHAAFWCRAAGSEQVALGHQRFQQLQLGIVQLEGLGVQLAVDAGIGEEDAVGQDSLTMCSNPELASSIIDCVARIMAAFFFLHVFSARVIQSRMMVLEGRSSLVDDEELERRAFSRSLDLRGRALQHVEQHRFENVRVLVPAIEVEGLEARERERVLHVVEEVAELPGLGPAVQALPERSENGREVGERPDLGGQLVHALQRSVERLLIGGVSS